MNNDTFIVKFSSTISGAILVIGGFYGNGEERKKALEKDGFDAGAVQKAVNDLLPIFNKYKE